MQPTGKEILNLSSDTKSDATCIWTSGCVHKELGIKFVRVMRKQKHNS